MDTFHSFNQNGNQSLSSGFGSNYNNNGKQEHFDDLSNPSFFGESNDYTNPFYAMQTVSLGKESDSVS